MYLNYQWRASKIPGIGIRHSFVACERENHYLMMLNLASHTLRYPLSSLFDRLTDYQCQNGDHICRYLIQGSFPSAGSTNQRLSLPAPVSLRFKPEKEFTAQPVERIYRLFNVTKEICIGSWSAEDSRKIIIPRSECPFS